MFESLVFESLVVELLASGFRVGSEVLTAGSGVDVGELVGLLVGSELLGGFEEVGSLVVGVGALLGGAAVVPPVPAPVAE